MTAAVTPQSMRWFERWFGAGLKRLYGPANPGEGGLELNFRV